MLSFWDTPNTQPHRAPEVLGCPHAPPEVMQGLFPCVNSPHLSFIAVPTSRTVSELMGSFTSVLSQSETQLGTPQGTSGKGGRLTPSYYHSVILCHISSLPRGLIRMVVSPKPLWLYHSFIISWGVVYYMASLY